jgi:hypothetical protein
MHVRGICQIKAGAENLILNPGRFVVLAISWLWRTRATGDCAFYGRK